MTDDFKARYNGLDIEGWYQRAERAESERDALRAEVDRLQRRLKPEPWHVPD